MFMLLYNKVQQNLAQVQLYRKRYFIINSSHASKGKFDRTYPVTRNGE